jgi:hypothetical protein
MRSGDTTQWKRSRLAHAFASMSHPYVLKFQSAAPAEGGGGGGAAARKWNSQYTFDVETEVKLGVWLRSLVIKATRAAVVERTVTAVALQDNHRAVHHPVAVVRPRNGGRRQSQRRNGQMQRP